jgi:triphosphoribosyl-dephospho-CoA synthase
MPLTAADIAAAAQLACLLEAAAPKPGNVSPGRPFADMRYEDFLASAAAIGAPLASCDTTSLGTTIREAISATRRWTRVNTNLGLVLLIAPLAKAAFEAAVASPGPLTTPRLRMAVRRVLAQTTIGDAREVYAAIRLARPGGLGTAPEGDVSSGPTGTLTEMMRLAADRDHIAREYATAFETTFDLGAPVLARARQDGLSWDEAIVETFLQLLAAAPDTHVVRRGGTALAAEVSRHAAEALAAGGPRTAARAARVAAMDAALQSADHLANPGTTADLCGAAVFVDLVTTSLPPV